jgi:hypothetical protein
MLSKYILYDNVFNQLDKILSRYNIGATIIRLAVLDTHLRNILKQKLDR